MHLCLLHFHRAARLPCLSDAHGKGSDWSSLLPRDCTRVQVQEWPALRPLVVVLKTLLKDNRLNEVSTGGLSSFALANMVLAHLLEETEARSRGCGSTEQHLLELRQQALYMMRMRRAVGGRCCGAS